MESLATTASGTEPLLESLGVGIGLGILLARPGASAAGVEEFLDSQRFSGTDLNVIADSKNLGHPPRPAQHQEPWANL